MSANLFPRTAGRAYDLKVIPTDVELKTDDNGCRYIKATVELNTRARKTLHTLIAKGRAMHAVQNKLQLGMEVSVRCVFVSPEGAKEDQCGQYLSVIGLPRREYENDRSLPFTPAFAGTRWPSWVPVCLALVSA